MSSTNALERLNHIYSLNEKSNNDDDPSFGGEYEVISQLCKELNIEKGYVIDIAASDGYTQSCTLGFFRREDWSGLAVEMDPLRFSVLAFLYAKFPNARLARNKVTPNNVKSLLDFFEVPSDISILNLDIDSYDLFVIEAMLNNNFMPKIISMEINEKIPPGIFFTVKYDPDHFWKEDHFYGCSIDAASSVVKPFGYVLHSVEYANAIFVRKDLMPDKLTDLTPEVAYNQGYRNRENRKNIFPWNANVENWLNSPIEESIESIRKYFSHYEGKFILMKT